MVIKSIEYEKPTNCPKCKKARMESFRRCNKILAFVMGVWYCSRCDIKYSPKQIVDQEIFKKR